MQNLNQTTMDGKHGIVDYKATLEQKDLLGHFQNFLIEMEEGAKDRRDSKQSKSSRMTMLPF